MRERCFLFVGGPFGPFFGDLVQELRRRGCDARRVITNGAEALDLLRPGALPYVGAYERFGLWVERQVTRLGVTDVVVYGDTYNYCREAVSAAQARGARLHVLEQGYFRPHWITYEAGGVNGHSQLPRDPAHYRAFGRPEPRAGQALRTAGRVTQAHVMNSFLTNVALYVFGPIFAGYRNPYAWSPLVQGAGHMARYLRVKIWRKEAARREARILALKGGFYLGLMQKPGDSQIMDHSQHACVTSFCLSTLENFAENAPAGTHLVFKCHPLDQGLCGHERAILAHARELGVEERVHYIDGGNLARLLRAARGAVTVNSTSGLAAAEFNCPIKTTGAAFYDMSGLTHQGDLASFWTDPQKPDHDFFLRFRDVVVRRTQINGGYSTAIGRRMLIVPLCERIMGDEARVETIHSPKTAPAATQAAAQ